MRRTPFNPLIPAILAGALAVGCVTPRLMAPPAQADNVILFIGDGMGVPAVTAASYARHGMGPGQPGLFFERFPVMGYTLTHSADSLVTDSASSATAMASGIKTNNGAIGVDVDEQPAETILEIAQARGMATGLVSSVPVNHATPAAFGAHTDSRNNYDAILEDLLTESQPQVVLGGGVRTDSGSGLIEAEVERRALAAGYEVLTVDDVGQLTAVSSGDRIFGWFDEDDDGRLAYLIDREMGGSNEPTLTDLAQAALTAVADDPDGFFLMIEGGAIDWAAHDNEAENNIDETLEFDRAIEEICESLEGLGLLDETLIIVTADHECGGINITGPYRSTIEPGDTPEIEFMSTNHTALPVLTFSRGPGSDALQGRHDNTDIFRAMRDALGGD